jgi:peptidoglycan/xylan/chitin deacetylase (PgdA/CDA1 family)
VTFDDGYTSVLDCALPILEEFGVPGTVFVTTDYVGRVLPMPWPRAQRWRGTEHEHELACLDWDQLRELQAKGWEIGAHSRSHPRLTELGDAELHEELTAARAKVSREMGRTCTSLAYPFGDFDERVSEAVAEAGYEAAGTMQPGPPEPLRFPRVGLFPADAPWRFWAKVSRTLLWMRSSRIGRQIEDRRQAALRRQS